MMNVIEQKLIREFKDRKTFSKSELYNFYRRYDPNLNEGTLGWRIYNLKQKNLIRTIKRGIYTMWFKPGFEPAVSKNLISLMRQINEDYEDINFCIWETHWLNEFSQHQAFRNMTIVEIEKEFVESLFYALKDNSRNDIFLNPNEKEITFYVGESENPVIVRNLITRSPVRVQSKRKLKIYTPELEKILVDIFTDDKLYYHVQGSELITIYTNAISKYSINYSKLFTYAKRRNKDHALKEFIINHMSNPITDFLK